MRTDWPRHEVSSIYHQPLLDLLLQAQKIHRNFILPMKCRCAGCSPSKPAVVPRIAAICPQSAHYQTGVERRQLMDKDKILTYARAAKAEGATRFCMGAAWRRAPEGGEFDSVLESVHTVAGLGLEVCCTLGMLTEMQAFKLKEAGLTAYNHNLDTSPEFYSTIISTRVYQDRLDTIAPYAKPALLSVAAASSAWVSQTTTCCISLPCRTPLRRVCPSTCLFALKERLWHKHMRLTLW
jgi:biotin synthase